MVSLKCTVGVYLCNHSDIYRASHIVSFNYPQVYQFSYRNMSILSFFVEERPIFEAGEVFCDTSFLLSSRYEQQVYWFPLL